MNWGEFKKQIESKGVTDDIVIQYIDTNGDEVISVE